jgi:diacylglycerol kinase family enzyme
VSRTVALVINASAGPNDRALAPGRITELFASFDCDAIVHAGPAGQVADLARRAAAGAHDVVAAGGGDGTVSTVAAIVSRTGASLGILPLGTLNHFARDLGIPLDTTQAIETIATGQAVRIDIGEVNGRTFVNNSSVGLYPSLVVERDRRRAGNRSRWLALALAIPSVLARYRLLAVRLEAGDRRRFDRTPLVFVGNNEYELEGFNLGARQRLDRGVLQVCVAPGLNRFALMRAIAAAVTGALNRSGAVESLLTPECVVDGRAREVLVALDGEVETLRPPLRYRTRPSALSVIVPAPAPK